MNIINILIKLLSAAYTAEAKRADAKAQFAPPSTARMKQLSILSRPINCVLSAMK